MFVSLVDHIIARSFAVRQSKTSVATRADLLVAIGQAKNAQENARRKWITRPWGQNEPQAYQYQTDAAEANLLLLEGRLENVRDEKKRVREELARAQRVSR